ncbi:MAG TPA: sigma-54 dependent transcriptional regulator [Polyangiaceae bacterium]
MRSVLVAWLGKNDLRAPVESDSVGQGPIAQALSSRDFAEAFLLSDYEDKLVRPYLKWLKARTMTRVEVLPHKLSGPTNFGEIYEAAVRGVEHALGKARDAQLSFHLSPGTPAMAAVWIILGKTRFPAELIESSREHGVRTASVPFDLSAEFLPDLLREQDERLKQTATGTPPEAPEFANIIHKSRVMGRLIERARRVAIRSVPVVIEGESGTGKELLARAIHRASPRRDKAFIAVNCGAIPAELVESELFGHKKGSFTGAHSDRKGHFKEADGGTLFLDELGELRGAAQVKLLRAIQEGEIVPLGESKPVKVDVRIVAATNRTLTEEIASGRFREDLFYRLAVAVLKLPSLRERQGDLGMLIDHLLVQVNREAEQEPGFKEKKLSSGARNLLLSHPWPGNVRELGNTLRRAAIWSDGAAISSEDVREALLPVATTTRPEVLGRPLGGGFDLRDLLKEVARHYLERAMDEAQGNKTKATELVGLPSYQTLTNWLKTYEVQG